MESFTCDVKIGERTIMTTVTADPTDVSNWLTDVTAATYGHNSTVVIGLDAEGKGNCGRRPATSPTSHVAVLQLCAGNRCLIVQLIHMVQIPDSLREFLANPRHVFAGVEVASDAANLRSDHGLVVGSLYDVREAALGGEPERAISRWPGLKELAREVAGVEIEKPRHVSVSDWGRRVLSGEQVEYACRDAFASFRVGQVLYYGFRWGDTEAECRAVGRVKTDESYGISS